MWLWAFDTFVLSLSKSQFYKYLKILKKTGGHFMICDEPLSLYFYSDHGLSYAKLADDWLDSAGMPKVQWSNLWKCPETFAVITKKWIYMNAIVKFYKWMSQNQIQDVAPWSTNIGAPNTVVVELTYLLPWPLFIFMPPEWNWVSSFCLVCLSVCDSVAKNLNIGHNFWTFGDRDFILLWHAYSTIEAFQMTQKSMTLWPSPWPFY